MKIVLIKRSWLGGWVLSLYDLGASKYVGNELFILPGNDDLVAKQLTAVLGEFGKDARVVGIMDTLKELCARYGVAVNPKWRTHRVPK